MLPIPYILSLFPGLKTRKRFAPVTRPEGPGELSPGFTLGWPKKNALRPEGARDTRPGWSGSSLYPAAPSGLILLGNSPRVNPGLSSFGHFGPHIMQARYFVALQSAQRRGDRLHQICSLLPPVRLRPPCRRPILIATKCLVFRGQDISDIQVFRPPCKQ
jgi:hypothetical protein